jgi:argininosuccinate lyase
MADALAAYQEKAAAFARQAQENAAREAAAAEELHTRFTALMGAA